MYDGVTIIQYVLVMYDGLTIIFFVIQQGSVGDSGYDGVPGRIGHRGRRGIPGVKGYRGDDGDEVRMIDRIVWPTRIAKFIASGYARKIAGRQTADFV